MSLNSPDKMPIVPNTMKYTEDEKALAKSVQAKNRRFGHLPTVAGTAAAALVIGGVGGYVASRGGEKHSAEPLNPESGTSAPVVPGENETTITLESMDAMALEEFSALPVEKQVDWTIYEANRHWNGEGEYAESSVLGDLMFRDSVDGQMIINYNPLYTPLTEEAKSTDILGVQTYYEQFASYKGSVAGRKLTSGMTFPGSSAYEYYVSTIGDDTNDPVGTKAPDDRIVINEQAIAPYVADDGKEYPQRKIVEQYDGITYVESYAFVESEALQELTDEPNSGLWLLTDFKRA